MQLEKCRFGQRVQWTRRAAKDGGGEKMALQVHAAYIVQYVQRTEAATHGARGGLE